MYRKNQLKEELDRLRKENNWLKNENTFLKERINTLNVEIHARNVEMQVKDLSNKLVESVIKQPFFIGVDGWKPTPNANPITVDTEEKDNND